MGIQMLTGFGGFQSYYRASEIPKVSEQEVQRQDALKQQSASISEEKNSQQIVETDGYKSEPTDKVSEQADRRPKIADLENISLTFNKEETYDYIGNESGLANLDMQKAISDMRKDEILQGYQYFVGNSNTLFQSEDGIVIPK